MIASPHFYAVIIGTEILNARRQDKHFVFIQEALISRGHKLHGVFIVNDHPALLRSLFQMIKNDPDAVMFSFGGIGSTPDDLTREIAAEIFTCKGVVRHEQFERAIMERFGEAAYPYRIHMADLPENAGLLKNPVNNMSGFYLEERYFFTPGFPNMAHPMVMEALERFYPKNVLPMHRATLLAETSENTLIDVMQTLPEAVEFSSLPMLVNDTPRVEISVAHSDIAVTEEALERFKKKLEDLKIPYKLL